MSIYRPVLTALEERTFACSPQYILELLSSFKWSIFLVFSFYLIHFFMAFMSLTFSAYFLLILFFKVLFFIIISMYSSLQSHRTVSYFYFYFLRLHLNLVRPIFKLIWCGNACTSTAKVGQELCQKPYQHMKKSTILSDDSMMKSSYAWKAPHHQYATNR